ncbi:MAG: tRNA (N(6)-L-threonylcarbamoyladenosine(37)-C(2))-methylthiotransferase MtaB [Clostridia bacterium]|nr:tRNA (N(6)-L-threonylcarbamoyladenosine(37)-C(2))-methylthiotransferase MtaB [Clostridia bacterium]
MSDKKRTAGIYTLGCKVNQYESEAMAEALAANGFEVISPTCACDIYIINTCTVTAESDRKARQFIRRAIAKNPSAHVIVTGCMAQTSPEAVAAIEGVDAVLGNGEKLNAVKIATELMEKHREPIITVGDIEAAGFEKMNITTFDRTRAYVKIEDGCESRCTYCIIPSARGKIRSKRPEDVLGEVETLVKGGCREVVLTGIETASYGKDLDGVDLVSLLCRVDKIPNIGRVRLGSLDPSFIKQDVAQRLSRLDSLAPHFHLSLQSGSNRILAAMKRKYNAEMAMRAIELLREYIPNVKFTTDIIVGFPGETEEDFNDTLNFVRKAKFLTAHIFPYSKRAGTPAAVMSGQIPKEEKSRRLHVLSQAQAEIRMRLLEKEISVRPERTVLFETYKNGLATGHTADFLEVSVPSDAPLHAQLRQVRLLSTDGNICLGELNDN